MDYGPFGYMLVPPVVSSGCKAPVQAIRRCQFTT